MPLGCAPACLSMVGVGRRKQFKFGAELLLAELSDVPLVNANLFVKLRLLDGGNFSAVSHASPVMGHRVVWKQEFNFVCRITSDPETGVLDACLCRVSVRKEAKGGKSYEKLGFVDINLSSFAGSGQEGDKRCYLLEGYTSDKGRRQDNSRLRVNVSLKLLTADTCFKVPTDVSCSSSATAGALLNPAERRAPHAPSTRSSVTDLGSQANLLAGLNNSSRTSGADCRRESDAASCSAASSSAHPSVAGAKFDSDPLEQGSMASSLTSSVAFRAGRHGDYANLNMSTNEPGGLTFATNKAPPVFADNPLWPTDERLRWAHADVGYYNSSSGYATTGRASGSTTCSSSAQAPVPPSSLAPIHTVASTSAQAPPTSVGGSQLQAPQPHSRYGSADSQHTGGRLSAASTPIKDCGSASATLGRAVDLERDRVQMEVHGVVSGFQTLPAGSSCGAGSRSRRTADTRVDPMRVIEDLLHDDLQLHEQLPQHDHERGPPAEVGSGNLAPDAHINRFLEDIIRNTADTSGTAHGDNASGGLALYVKRDEGVAAVVAPGPGFERVTMPRQNRR